MAAQNLTNIAWAYAPLGVRDVPLFDAMSSPAMARMAVFDSQHLGNTAWAFATLQVGVSRPLLEAIATAALRCLTEFNMQELANTAWSFANLAFWHEPLFSAIA